MAWNFADALKEKVRNSEDINDILIRARKLRDEIPHLIAPSRTDLDVVQMLREIERLRTELSNAECQLEQIQMDALEEMEAHDRFIDEVEGHNE